MKIYFLGNYTQEFIVKKFKKLQNKVSHSLETRVSGFNQYYKEIIDKDSSLYNYNPEVVYLSIDLYTLVEDFINLPDIERDINVILSRCNQIGELLLILHNRLSKTKIFIDNFVFLKPKSMLTLSYNSKSSISILEDMFNESLLKIANDYSDISIIDLKNIISEYGLKTMVDERMYYISKSPWSNKGLDLLSSLYFRYLKSYLGLKKKCIVLDLDNTLWGGIIGEDGINNIQLSKDGLGKAFTDFQREILKLHERGIILAICSKNTENIALNAINKHPNMVLKTDNFAIMKINWYNKADNIREIAEELNIGLDSLVFFDDSRQERELVSKELPEVCVPDLPEDPVEYANFIRRIDLFDYLTLTEDDYKRNSSYKSNVIRKQIQKKVTNIEDYYHQLEMEVEIFYADDFSIPRIAQLTQKTNQFNLRTKRFTTEDIKCFCEDKYYEVFCLSLKDKFGDNGIVGTSIIRKMNREEIFIDTFIFSCRAIGRTAETALLNRIILYAKNHDFKYLIGEYIVTKKNQPCKDFYKKHNFSNFIENLWRFEIKTDKINPLPWMQIEIEER